VERSVRALVRIGRRGLGVLIDAAFPAGCAACGERLVEVTPLPLCDPCAASAVEAGPPFCRTCADAGRDALGCTRRDHPRLRAAWTWNDALRALVHAYKFDGAPELAAPLVDAALDTAAFADRPRPDAIVAVPLHGVRRRERGYDQAEALARVFAARLGVPWVAALVRCRATGQQARLGAVARRANVAGAFAPRDPSPVRGLDVALVDDVVTTGATVDAAAAALVAAGAASVETWALAHEPLS